MRWTQWRDARRAPQHPAQALPPRNRLAWTLQTDAVRPAGQTRRRRQHERHSALHDRMRDFRHRQVAPSRAAHVARSNAIFDLDTADGRALLSNLAARLGWGRNPQRAPLHPGDHAAAVETRLDRFGSGGEVAAELPFP